MNLDKLRAEEMEPLCDYQTAINDAGQVMIAVPGYFKGSAHDAVLLCGGGEDALLVRNPHQILICDAIHPEVRARIPEIDRVLIYEVDAEREYLARVERADIDALLEEARKLRGYDFPLHPFPVLDGTFDIGEAQCDYCDNTHRVNYRGETERGPETVCPWCIQDMYPVRSGNTLFPDLDSRVEDEFDWCSVGGDTPPYFDQGRVAPLWGMHCGKFGAYLGQLEPEDLTDALRAALTETWDNKFNCFRDRGPDAVFADFAVGKLTAHLFRCVACKGVFCIFYERLTDALTMRLSEFVRGIGERCGDSFTETWFHVKKAEDGSAVITEMCGDRGYYTIEIDPTGEIVHGERYDYVRQLKKKGVRIVPDEPDEEA